MNNDELKVKFNMTYGDLLQVADKLVLFGRRDQAHLNRYGITLAWLDNLEAQNDVCKHFPTDNEMLGRQRRATLDKDNSRDRLQHLVSIVTVQIKGAYGEDSPEYSRCGLKAINVLPDSDYARMARNAHHNILDMLPSLGASGLTLMDLSELEAAIDQFDRLIDLKSAAVAERDKKTVERVTLLNQVYDMVVMITDYAKAVFHGVNPALYNDYVIYDVPSTANAANAKKSPAKEEKTAPATEEVTPPVVEENSAPKTDEPTA